MVLKREFSFYQDEFVAEAKKSVVNIQVDFAFVMLYASVPLRFVFFLCCFCFFGGANLFGSGVSITSSFPKVRKKFET